MTKVAALEHAQHSIRVNTICHGPVRTPMSHRVPHRPDLVSATLASLLGNVLAGLDGLERRVLELRFGLGAEAPDTPGQAARVLGITPRRVRCAEDRALRHLRASPATGACATLPDPAYLTRRSRL